MANNNHLERPTIEPRWLMPAVDLLLVLVAFGLSYALRYNLQIIRPINDPTRADLLPYIPYALVYAGMLYLNYVGNDLYKNLRGRALSEEITIIINGVTIATVILLAMFFLLQPLVTSRLMLVYVASLTTVLLSVARVIRRTILAHYRTKGIGVQRVLIVGMGETGQAVLGTMISRLDYGFQVIGYLDDNPQKGGGDLGRVEGLGGLDQLKTRIKEYNVDMVVITLPWKHYDRVSQLATICQQNKVEVRIVPDIFQLNMRQVQVENLDGIPLLGITYGRPLKGTSRLYKRVMDSVIVIATAPAWVLLMAMVAAAIRLEGAGNIFYTQTRVGENGHEFKMMKFRSMIPNADALREELIKQHNLDPKHPKLEDDPRVTRIGKFIRRTSLDELPNVLNVLKGEMSLVGPRPPTPDEVALYEEWHKQRLQIIPGLTGLWQVSGRSQIPFDEMCLMDIYYIENWSIKFDLQILLMTIPRVLLRSGAY